MTALPLPSTGANAKDIVIERPRASDAIGGALRNAFEREYTLPPDMMTLLHKLNGDKPIDIGVSGRD